MKVVIFILALTAIVAVATATSDEEYQTAFTSWMHTHQKAYAAEEFQTRFAAFKDNHDFVANWDAAARGFEVETNALADMTVAEYSKTYLGTRVHTKLPMIIEEVEVTASSVDWRTKGYVTPIKNQGQCGSCWSFSTTGSTEGANFKKTGKLQSFSEQQLVDCSGSFGNQGCNGGLMDSAFKYIQKNKLTLESDYPYRAVEGACNLKDKPLVGTVSSFTDVARGSESSLTAALTSAGPVSVAIDASHSSFQLYKAGVYYEAACSSTSLDHGVLAVGFGTSGSSDFYIVKNSWGTTWGLQGYINMARNRNNNCGIASQASFPLA